MSKQRLELTWINKDKRPALEPRILLEDTEKSYHAPHRVTHADIFDNMLIHGDNLLALKALEQEYTGKVKCIYIDPPYNTGSAFEHYDDGVEHSLWLSLMRDRIELLYKLLSEDGSLWVTLDDNEAHYFKVMCDEIFGRKNFISSIVWQNRYSRSNDALISLSHNTIFLYSKNPIIWKKTRNRLPRTNEQAKQYNNPDNDPMGPWRAIPWDAPNIRQNLSYEIITPKGTIRKPPQGRCWSRTEDQWHELVKSGRAYFGKNQDGAPSFKQYLFEASAIVPNTWWAHEDAGHTDEAKKEIHSLFGTKSAFDTPKPERLIQRVLHIATNPGDLVLDSFLGSGTTAAVAHKMGRRWIGIELGEHCYTHCVPRLQKVINGEDQGGISKTVNWQGGGGFRFYELGASLIKTDTWGNPIINKEFNAEMLTHALCKLSGFTYMPDREIYWMQGQGSETDYLYATTQFLSAAQLLALNDEVGEERSLLVYCTAFRLPPKEGDKNGGEDALPRLTVKKIPNSILAACEWNKDDYSLNIQNLPQAEITEPVIDHTQSTKKKRNTPQKKGQSSLFDVIPHVTQGTDADE